MTYKLLECNRFVTLGLCVLCVCVSTFIKTEMKCGTRFTEQLPGFHSVSADLRSHSPQPLCTSSSGSHMPWIAGDSAGAAFTGRWKDAAEPLAGNSSNKIEQAALQ